MISPKIHISRGDLVIGSDLRASNPIEKLIIKKKQNNKRVSLSFGTNCSASCSLSKHKKCGGTFNQDGKRIKCECLCHKDKFI